MSKPRAIDRFRLCCAIINYKLSDEFEFGSKQDSCVTPAEPGSRNYDDCLFSGVMASFLLYLFLGPMKAHLLFTHFHAPGHHRSLHHLHPRFLPTRVFPESSCTDCAVENSDTRSAMMDSAGSKVIIMTQQPPHLHPSFSLTQMPPLTLTMNTFSSCCRLSTAHSFAATSPPRSTLRCFMCLMRLFLYECSSRCP